MTQITMSDIILGYVLSRVKATLSKKADLTEIKEETERVTAEAYAFLEGYKKEVIAEYEQTKQQMLNVNPYFKDHPVFIGNTIEEQE